MYGGLLIKRSRIDSYKCHIFFKNYSTFLCNIIHFIFLIGTCTCFSLQDLNDLLSAFGLGDSGSSEQVQPGSTIHDPDVDNDEPAEEITIDSCVNSFVAVQTESEHDRIDSDNDDPQRDLDKLESIYDKGCGCTKKLLFAVFFGANKYKHSQCQRNE